MQGGAKCRFVVSCVYGITPAAGRYTKAPGQMQPAVVSLPYCFFEALNVEGIRVFLNIKDTNIGEGDMQSPLQSGCVLCSTAGVLIGGIVDLLCSGFNTLYFSVVVTFLFTVCWVTLLTVQTLKAPSSFATCLYGLPYAVFGVLCLWIGMIASVVVPVWASALLAIMGLSQILHVRAFLRRFHEERAALLSMTE